MDNMKKGVNAYIKMRHDAKSIEWFGNVVVYNNDDKALVFAVCEDNSDAMFQTELYPEDIMALAEEAMIEYFHGSFEPMDKSVPIRVDHISFNLISSDRAIIRCEEGLKFEHRR